jgi:hypothetical protein
MYTTHIFGVLIMAWGHGILTSLLPLLVLHFTAPSLKGSEFVDSNRRVRLSCHTIAVTSSFCSFLLSPLLSFSRAGFLN